jgi:hypothetical protein
MAFRVDRDAWHGADFQAHLNHLGELVEAAEVLATA